MSTPKTARSFRPEDIRNIALIGRHGSGKTTLAEALLHRCGAITRMGSVTDHTTTSDIEPESKAHGFSTSATVLFATKDGRELNVIDTPGHPDFIGHALAALPAVEIALLVIDATIGVDPASRRLFVAAGEAGLARMVVVNKIDLAGSSLPTLVSTLRSQLGPTLHCLNLPSQRGTDVIDCFDSEAGPSDFGSVSDIHQEVLEATVEVDDAEMEKYLLGERITPTELRSTFVKAMVTGHMVPIVFTAARGEVGIDDLLHILINEGPSPLQGRVGRLVRDGVAEAFPCDADRPFIAHVWKVTTDPYTGKLALLRVIQGRLDGTTTFLAGEGKHHHRASHVLKVEGRDHPELSAAAFAGDIVAVAKIDELRVDQILHAPEVTASLTVVRPNYPVPVVSLAVSPKNKTDDVKLGVALHRLVEEDPTLRARQDPLTKESVLSGLGDLHLRITLEKLKNRFNVEVQTRPPRIAYKETISARAEGHHRLRKQTGGSGQFAEVFLRVEPLGRGEGFRFESAVVGGSIPTQYISSVEKGVIDGLEGGVLAGYALEDVKVIVYDGKSHPVDSKDMAFRTAGKLAFRDAAGRARPVLLEPIVAMDITIPESHLGTVTADTKNLRARVVAVDSLPGGQSLVRVLAPLAEIGAYAGQLRGETAGQGSFTLEFSHHEIVPALVQQRVVADYKPRAEEE